MTDLYAPYADVATAVFWVLGVMTALGWAADMLLGMGSPNDSDADS